MPELTKCGASMPGCCHVLGRAHRLQSIWHLLGDLCRLPSCANESPGPVPRLLDKHYFVSCPVRSCVTVLLGVWQHLLLLHVAALSLCPCFFILTYGLAVMFKHPLSHGLRELGFSSSETPLAVPSPSRAVLPGTLRSRQRSWMRRWSTTWMRKITSGWTS